MLSRKVEVAILRVAESAATTKLLPETALPDMGHSTLSTWRC